MSLIGLLVALLVICLLYWAAMKLMGAFGIGDPIRTVVLVIFVVIVVLWLVSAFMPGAMPRLR
jgi:uncharacterized membrane protein YwzB